MSTIKKRANNFSFKEEKTLLALVKKYANEIECKKTDVNTNKLKTQAYEKLALEFNSISGEYYRDAKALRGKYENLKKTGKKKFSDDKAHLRGTGGGPAKTSSSSLHESELNVDLQEILGHQMTGFNSEFDHDSELTIVNSNNKGRVLVANTGLAPVDVVLDWSQYSPDMLRSGPSSALKLNNCEGETINKSYNEEDGSIVLDDRNLNEVVLNNDVETTNSNLQNEAKTRHRKRPLQDKITKWASSKTTMVELQGELMKKEHDLKLDLMKSKHQTTIDLEKKESDHRIELMNQKHAKEMELLDLQLETFKTNLKKSIS